jgi:hypothetical protein
MGGSSPPPPTPPRETSAAQTGANISTAIANNFMSNANLISADGSTQKTEQTGTYTFTDPYTNQTYDIPTFTRTEALSDIRKQTLDQGNQANLNLATLGANTSKQLIGNMKQQLTAQALGRRPTLGAMQQAGAGPQLGLAGSAPTMQRAGNIANMERAGPVSDMGRLGQSRQMSLARSGQAMDRLGEDALPQMRLAGDGPAMGLMGEGSVPNLRTSYVDDFSADRSRVEDALFSRLNPKLQQDRSALETQLSNQGIKLGSAAYDRAMGNFGQQSNDARMAAIMAGGQEQSRMAGLARDQAMFGNNAGGQQFAMRQARQGFDNAALQSMSDNNLQRVGFNNAALQQMSDNRARQAGFNNTAGQSEFQNNLAESGFNNAANQQMDDSDFRRAGFNNTAAQSDIQNRLAATGFNNTAAQSDIQNRLAATGFDNTAAQSDFQNNIASTGFNNTAAQQMGDNDLRRAGFNNSLAMDQYNAALTGRTQHMQEAFALDNQPINKAMALASGTQVANPQFQPLQVNRIPTTDNAGIIQNYDQQNFQRWQAEEQSRNQLLGGLMGGVSSMGAAWLRSDRDLKENIEKVGTLKGHGLYEYNFKGDDEKQIGVMAQEVKKKRPDAVKKSDDGTLMVNYGALFNAGKKGSR